MNTDIKWQTNGYGGSHFTEIGVHTLHASAQHPFMWKVVEFFETHPDYTGTAISLEEAKLKALKAYYNFTIEEINNLVEYQKQVQIKISKLENEK